MTLNIKNSRDWISKWPDNSEWQSWSRVFGILQWTYWEFLIESMLRRQSWEGKVAGNSKHSAQKPHLHGSILKKMEFVTADFLK